MLTDQQDNTLSGATAQSVHLYNQAVRAFNIYRGDPLALLNEATEAAPEFAIAHIAKAHIYVASSEPAAMADARSIVATAKGLRLNERERSHIAALELLLSGEWTNAALALDGHNIRFPHDLLALQSGHLIDFLRASARNLRDRIARVLPTWSQEMPGYSILLGMYAFGLEECGDYARAEAEGRRALAAEPLDCWAHHAVAHVMEMQGRSEDGIGWMIAREPYWSGDDNGFKVHNWWHHALFYLDLDRTHDALKLYDVALRHERTALALDLVDASALLWRLTICGVEVADRWQELAQSWLHHADGVTYPFNDWHATMALLGAGRDKDIDRVVAALRNSAGANSETSRWARDWGLPLIEGFRAFWHADYDTAIERLYRSRHIVNAFGGSHAQRDVIDFTLTQAALRSGNWRLAESLAHERLATKPHSRLNLELLSRAVGRLKHSRQAA